MIKTIEILTIILLIIIILNLFFKLVHDLKECVVNLLSNHSFKSPPFCKKNEEEKDEVEYSGYNIDEFNKRIEKLKKELNIDEDGLYDVEEDYNGDETGVEIVTNSQELELDRRINGA